MRARMIAMILSVFPVVAAAQQPPATTGLAGLLPGLILRDVTLPSATHGAHFSPLSINDPTNPAVEVVQSFNKQLVVQLSTVPIGSSSGGFTYTFDPTVGTFRRASRSFGPAFAERALTAGRGRFNAGMNYQHLSYSTFEDRDSGRRFPPFLFAPRGMLYQQRRPARAPRPSGLSTSRTASRFDPFFEGDLVQTSLSLNARTDSMVFFGNYGLTDRLDVGIAVPLVRVELDATLVATILRLATGTAPIHTFEPGNLAATDRTFTASGTASGLGDIVLRSKYRFAGGVGAALAGAVDVRLPTGDRDNLLGAGAQTKVFLIASNNSERWGQHVNAGYSFASGQLSAVAPLGASAVDVPDEFNYTAGIEFVAESRVTIIGDVVGRVLLDAGRLAPRLKTFEFVPGAGEPVSSAQFEEFEPRAGNLHVMFGTVGVKYNPVGNLLINASVLVPATKAGLRSHIGAVIGIDYAF